MAFGPDDRMGEGGGGGGGGEGRPLMAIDFVMLVRINCSVQVVTDVFGV